MNNEIKHIIENRWDILRIGRISKTFIIDNKEFEACYLPDNPGKGFFFSKTIQTRLTNKFWNELSQLRKQEPIPSMVIIPSPLDATSPDANEHKIPVVPFRREKGMFLAKALPSSSTGFNLDFRFVQSEKDFEKWQHIILKSFHISDEEKSKILPRYFQYAGIHLLLAGFDKETLTTAMMIFEKNACAGIYFIATLPEHRRKGLASSCLHHAINYCHSSGIKNIILHAVPQGISIYQKLGFKEYCNFDFYYCI